MNILFPEPLYESYQVNLLLLYISCLSCRLLYVLLF